MSRTTDVQRGAEIAHEAACAALIQPDMFDAGYPVEFWKGIELAALDQLEECDALRAALAVPA